MCVALCVGESRIIEIGGCVCVWVGVYVCVEDLKSEVGLIGRWKECYKYLYGENWECSAFYFA